MSPRAGALIFCLLAASGSMAQSSPIDRATDVIAPDAHLLQPVGGLENTGAEYGLVPVEGQPFKQAFRVVIKRTSADTNATQLTLNTSAPVKATDTLLARFWIRGQQGPKPARMELLFEKSSSPWGKSMSRMVYSSGSPSKWRLAEIPFTSGTAYGPGEAMLSFRLAFGPQTVEIGGVRLLNLGTTPLDSVFDLLAAQRKPDPVAIQVNRRDLRQTLAGLGGNFCQPRYGETRAMDPVGERLLQTLKVTGARVGIPLNNWAPEPNLYSQENQALASFQAIKLLKAKNIPVIASVWEPPRWMLPGQPEEQGQSLHADKWDACIEAIGEYLRTAKEYFGASPDYFSFNEPDYGVNVKMSPQEQARFIRDASKAWAAKGIKVKFLIGDTASGTNLAPYVEHLMAQRDLLPHLGPIAYHTWDALGAPDDTYENIARLGRQHKKAIWATEAGHDAQLWQKPNPWASWENALGLVRAYSRSYRLSGAERLDYWTYQDNYTLLDPKTLAPHSAFNAMKLMEAVFAPGRKLAWSKSDGQGVEHAATLSGNGRQMMVLLSNEAGAVPVQLSGLLPSRSFRVSLTGPNRSASTRAVRSDSQGRLTLPLPTRAYALLTSQ